MTPWTAARQVPLSLTVSWSLLKLTSTESVMLSDNLILYCPVLFLPSSLLKPIWMGFCYFHQNNLTKMRHFELHFPFTAGVFRKETTDYEVCQRHVIKSLYWQEKFFTCPVLRTRQHFSSWYSFPSIILWRNVILWLFLFSKLKMATEKENCPKQDLVHTIFFANNLELQRDN